MEHEKAVNFRLSDEQKLALVRAWHSMIPWQDMPEGLQRSRTRYEVFIATCLSRGGGRPLYARAELNNAPISQRGGKAETVIGITDKHHA